MPYKLIKVAKAFNVGLHTIVEHLHSQGFTSVEDKPNADVSDEMYEVLQKEFQKELAIKQEADKLLRPSAPRKDVPAPAPSPKPMPIQESPVVPKQQPKAVDPAPTVAEQPAVREPARVAPGLKIVGRIQVDAGRPSSQKEKPKEDAAAVKTAVNESAVPASVEPPVSDPDNDKKTAAQTVQPGVSPEASDAVAPSDSGKGKPPEGEMYRADSPQLRGLKVLGKINLEDQQKKEEARVNAKKDERNKRRDQSAPRPAGAAGAAPGTISDQEKRKRKRKKVQQPVTAENLQKSMMGNQGDRRAQGGVRRDEPQQVSQKEIEDKIRQTMLRMGAGASKKRQKIRRGKRETMREKAEMEQAQMDAGTILSVTEFISVSDLASLMNLKPSDVIKACMSLGIFVSINQRLDAEVIELVANEFGYEVQFISAEEQVEVEQEEVDIEEDLRPRQPIVTVMGHVDHGKTSLLDYIRSANVAGGEAGGITQHIGAYEVTTEGGKKITFLDTPGHEAFTAMRARGAKVTDIAVIVIAADDNIMPQTREAISHAQAAGVPLVFAINKVDKNGADPERIKGELAQMNLLVEDWGGKYQSQDISAKTGLNIDKLLEKVLLEAELLDLKANPSRRAVGTLLEASMEKGRGYVTKILIENGTLRDGDPIIAGEFSGRVKAMFNERGKKIKEAGPACPVLVLGLPGAPQAGEKVKVTSSEGEAKEIAARRGQILREQANRATKRISLEEIGRRLALGNFKELNLIVKGDVDGSVEALSDSLQKLSVENVQVNIIHKAVGQIVDSDVMLASASDAIIIGFQVRPSLSARKLAEKEGVEIKSYSIIYEAIGEIKSAMEGLLEPTKEEEITGQVEVREVYKISKVGTVAGCYVQEGKVNRNSFVRIVRDGIIVYPINQGQNAEIASLKRFKEDIKEVRAGLECGITIKNFNDIKVGDIIEAYVIKEVKATL
jgi:translation initiation factor IF-2